MAEKIDETESKFIQKFVKENEYVFSQAIECCSELQHFKERLSKSNFGEGPTEKIAFSALVNLQKEMQSVMMSQLKQQHEF